MRPKYFAGIIIGILLLYLGFMGAAGIGFTWSAGTLPTKEDFNDLAGWQIIGTPAISPTGQVLLQGSTDTYRCSITSTPGSPPGPAIAAVQTGSSYTISLRMKVDSWGSAGYLSIQIYGSTTYMAVFDVYQSQVQSYNKANTWSHSFDSDWHTYTMIVTAGSNPSIDFYVGSLKLGTSTSAATGTNLDPRLSFDTWSGITCHIDWVNVAPGAIVPTGGDTNPGQATLTINAQDSSGNSLSAPVTVTDAGGDAVGPRNTPTTFGPYSPGTFTISAAPSVTVGSTTYGFTRWSDGETSSTISYNLQSTTTLTATYTAGQTSPTPTPSGNGNSNGNSGGQSFGNFTAIIINFLNNSSLRELEMAVGGLTAVISGIIFILPGEKRYYQQAPPPRY